jgi:hypothetical protein
MGGTDFKVFEYVMKRNLSVLFLIQLFIIAGCGNKSRRGDGNIDFQAADTGKAMITFNEYEHDFGKVNEGEKIGCIFTFQNTGTSDLVINSAVTSCGCTVSKYNRKPIAPGNSGTLEVIFDTSGRDGIQTKTITVRSNAKVQNVFLKITAEVINSNNN